MRLKIALIVRRKVFKINFFIFSLIITLFFTACEDKKEHKLLKVGITPWPGYEPLVIASEKGYFNDANIRLVRFTTPTDSYRAFRDGIIDVTAFTADEVFHYADVENKPHIFLVLDISNGADAIVARKEIKTLDGLKGKKIGIEGSSLGDYLIHRALDFTEKLAIKDMKFVHVPIGKQEDAYRRGEIDAAVTYEPSKSRLVKAGAHVLFDSKKLPHEIVDVLVANNKTMTTRSDDLRILAEGWFSALEYIKTNKKEAMQRMAKYEFISVEDFTKGFNDLIIPFKEDNLKMLRENGSLLKPMQRLAELMFQKGTLKKKIDVKPLLDNQIIESLKK